MAAVYAGPDAPASDRLAHERRMQNALCTITSRGWEQRLEPFAAHLAERRLVRARSAMGPPVTRVDVGSLQQALSQMLRLDANRAYLIVAVAVEDASPQAVAAELGLEPSHALDELRTGLDALARLYEEQAWLACAMRSSSWSRNQ